MHKCESRHGGRRWFLNDSLVCNESIVCLECRQVFDITPQQCPSCEHNTFVHFADIEDPNAICEELLFTAALVQMGFDQAQLNRSAVSKSPVVAEKRAKAVPAVAGRAN